MALAGKRTAAAGGADATQTSAAGVFSVIESLLLAAGWTEVHNYFTGAVAWQPSTVLPPFNSTYGQGAMVTNASNLYQCIQGGIASTSPTGPTGEGLNIVDGTVRWRFITSSAGSAKVFFSDGESGAEKIWLDIRANTNTTPAVNIYPISYFSGGFAYNPTGGTSIRQYTFTAGNTVNYAMAASKDGFMAITNDSANARRLMGGGNLIRQYTVLQTNFVSDNAVTAGANKTFTFASGDPVAAGYKPDDRVIIVSQQTNGASPYSPQIPLYAARVTAVTTNSITIDFAQEGTNAGALIGADPQPLFTLTNSANNDPTVNASNVFFNYIWNPHVTNLWAVNVETGYTNNGTGGSLVTNASAQVDPNNRTSRVVIGEVAVISLDQELVGFIPHFFSNPRTTDALWSIGRSVKESTNYDYVTFPSNTASPAGQRRQMVGPFAISGGATFNVDIYRQDADTWIQAEVPYVLWPGMDRAQSQSPFMREKDGWPFLAEPLTQDNTPSADDSANFVLSGVPFQAPNTAEPAMDRVGSIASVSPTGELTPFDSAEAAAGGGVGGGFNSGFN